jgi:hypothetical protein
MATIMSPSTAPMAMLPPDLDFILTPCCDHKEPHDSFKMRGHSELCELYHLKLQIKQLSQKFSLAFTMIVCNYLRGARLYLKPRTSSARCQLPIAKTQ